MTNHDYPRQINFESVFNFRDLGGYETYEGYTVAWRRLFRSGELHHMTEGDLIRLREEFGLTAVIDLRSSFEIKQQGVGLLSGSGIKYHNVSFITDGGDRKANELRYQGFTNMGEFYLYLVRQKEFVKRIVEALDIIAAPENHPLIFHCSAGKDRTGILAAVLLSLLNVKDEDIIHDYSISQAHIEALLNRLKSQPQMAEDLKSLPEYFWTAAPDSMALFLATLKEEYGSVRGYLKTQGADLSLIHRLEKALLT